MVIAALASGCTLPSLSAPGTLSQLQILSVVVDPPLVRPGDVPSATVWIADPTGEGFELLLWTCTDLGSGCIEPLVDLAIWTDTPVVSNGVSNPWRPDLNTEELPPDVSVPISLYALACAPGLCPEIGRVHSGDATVADVLADPVAFGLTLPLDGTSLVRRGVDITGNLNAKINENPKVTEAPKPAEYANVSGGSQVSLHFLVSDETDMTAEGFTTGGSMSSGEWTGHELVFTWDAPNAAGDYELWVAIEDGTGGGAVWRGVSHVE